MFIYLTCTSSLAETHFVSEAMTADSTIIPIPPSTTQRMHIILAAHSCREKYIYQSRICVFEGIGQVTSFALETCDCR